MVKCIIVDGNKSDRKAIEGIISQVKHLNLIKSCGKFSEIKELLATEKVDILFLDIPDLSHNGIAFSEDSKPKIIVTSAVKDTAKHAYDLDAIDFILKPITVPRVIKSLSKAIGADGVKEILVEDSSIYIKAERKFVKLYLNEILMVEALSDYVNIYTTAKRYTVHGTMKSMEEKLPKKDFIRVHKSYIVRLEHVSAVEREKIFIDDKKIPVSNSYRKELMERLKIL